MKAYQGRSPCIQALELAKAINGERLWHHLMTLASIGATRDNGVDRQAFTPADREARAWLTAEAKRRGFAVLQDRIGNLFIRKEGKDPAAAPVMMGSHLDSQPTGGRFDGAYGVMAGFEVLEALADHAMLTNRPLEVAAFANEEGSRFQPGAMGSAVYAGQISMESLLDRRDWQGIALKKELDATLGALEGAGLRETPVTPFAYLEAHIEQGPELEASSLPIGVVTGVQGMQRLLVHVHGREAHAGTTPRRRRRDALMRACRIAVALDDTLGAADDDLRLTIGRFDVSPGSPNTVPGAVAFTIDLRHPEGAALEDLQQRIAALCAEHAPPCRFEISQVSNSAPVQFATELVDLVQACARAAELDCQRMLSGAGHDAMNLARICKSAMIFVPCKDGVSHHPDESARKEDLLAGAKVLAAAAADLALG